MLTSRTDIASCLIRRQYHSLRFVRFVGISSKDRIYTHEIYTTISSKGKKSKFWIIAKKMTFALDSFKLVIIMISIIIRNSE